MTAIETQVRWLMRRAGMLRDGKPVAIVAGDGVWLDGEAVTLADYETKLAGAARHELTAPALSVADLLAETTTGNVR